MQLQFLGTGAGMPSKERNVTSIALKLLDEIGSIWLFDCGEATQHQILQTAIKPRRVDKIFITHMHGDHIYGLPGFLGSRSFLGGESPLTIVGPAEVKDFVEATIRYSKTHLTYPIHFVEVQEGVVYEDEHFIVHAKKLQHVIDCFGYRVEQKDLPGQLLVDKVQKFGVPRGPLYRELKSGRDITLEDGAIVRAADVLSEAKKGFTVTILGDTKYCNTSIELSKEADIVVHEATFDSSTTDLAASYGHSTNTEAASIAKLANAKNLILTHLSARFLKADIERLVNESQTIFPSTFAADDFALFELKNSTLMKQ
ncbi:ribonuclease Z [Lysinibacillus odysseyi]|uniref:Ribonuclease Z n=1 Tax=Lysinibacillus odysseyi 34hs-1 = NBRC 100172 TaxID=1220589 RepID=A0A0A3IFV5_9BACI|nr:ribonuclease Z [Lysinibacillus odysseyi]KGR81703.1 ribonuclease Z [Lysinibacillus odysseyi 34hs-1 = NBRC 100172]